MKAEVKIFGSTCLVGKSEVGTTNFTMIPTTEYDSRSLNSRSPTMINPRHALDSKQKLRMNKQNKSNDSVQEILIEEVFENKDSFAKAFQILRSGQVSNNKCVRPKSQKKKLHSSFFTNSRRVHNQQDNQAAQNLQQDSLVEQVNQKYRTQSQIIQIPNKKQTIQKESNLGFKLEFTPETSVKKILKNNDLKNVELQELSMFNTNTGNSPKNIQADDCYKVLQKLARIQNNLVGRGQTTALKHFKNQGEATRFQKSLQELNQLKDKLLLAENEKDQYSIAYRFIARAKSEKFKLEYYTKKIGIFIGTLFSLDLPKIDPQYSLSDIIKRILRQQNVYEDPREILKQFEVLKEQQLLNRLKYSEIEQRKRNKNTEERIQNYCQNQSFYDISDIFWSQKNPALLVNRYENTSKKIQDHTSNLNLNTLESFIEENHLIKSPEIPQPSIAKQFPFASQMGRPKSKLNYERRNHSSFAETYTSQNGNKKRELKNFILIKNRNNKSNQPSLTQTKMIKTLHEKTIMNLEQDSLLQRNRILLERVIYDRKKFEEISGQTMAQKSSLKQKHPPSNISWYEDQSKKDTQMVFVKNEDMIFQD